MKSFIRFLCHNRLYSLINLAGLSLSLSFSIIVFSYAYAQRRVSKSVPDYEDVYAVERDGAAMLCSGISGRLVTLPEAESVTMFSSPVPDEICEFGGAKFLASSMSADNEFLNIFGVEFIAGGTEPLSKSGIYISESFARRIAGDDDPCGRSLTLDGSDFNIEGIFKDFGKGLLPHTDIIMDNSSPSSEIAMYGMRPLVIFGNVQVFVKTAPDTDITDMEQKFNGLFNDVDHIGGHLSLMRADEFYFDDGNIMLNRGESRLIRGMIAAGLVLTLIALLNYINLNTALIGRRAKEMAIKRILGLGKNEILFQYILESTAFTSICFIIAILLALPLSPLVGRITMDVEEVSASALVSTADIFAPANLAFCFLICLLAGIIAGVIPALAAQRISPADTVKGGFRTSSKRILTKVFIVVQNIISITLIAMAITMELQTRHMLDRPAGCVYEDILYLDCGSYFEPQDYDLFMEKLRSLPCVSQLGICNGIPGDVPTSYDMTTQDGQAFRYYAIQLDTVAFDMLQFNILRQIQPCIPGTVWLTENTMRLIGIDMYSENISENETVKNSILVNSGGSDEVCGIVSDFIINDPGDAMAGSGAVIEIVDDMTWKSFIIRTGGDHDAATKMIAETYRNFCREKWGVDGGEYVNIYMKDMLRDRNADALRSLRLIELLMLLAVLLSLSGLVAISIHYTELYEKSIAIHKVFGARTSDETIRNLRLYFAITAVAGCISIPAAFALCRRYLENFSYRIELSIWIFVATFLLAMGITFLSVIMQVGKAADANPIKALRKE